MISIGCRVPQVSNIQAWTDPARGLIADLPMPQTRNLPNAGGRADFK